MGFFMLSFDWVIHVFTYQIKKGKCFNIYIYTVYLNLTLGQTLKSMLKSYFFFCRGEVRDAVTKNENYIKT